jgi:fumarate reductase flavoprotein subunit
LLIAGAGMAGLCAAARARELGAAPTVVEKGTRPGGSMLVSSCVVWRYRSLELFREQCPGGDPELQRLVIERLDDGIEWLESLGAPVVASETGNPLTIGTRFDPHGLTQALVRAGAEPRLASDNLSQASARDNSSLASVGGEPLVLATGGFGGDPDLVAQHIRPAAPLALRANPWSAGDGLRAALARGAATTAGMDEFYGRNMPDTEVCEQDFVRAAQLYARHATVVNDDGEEFLHEPISWSEIDVVQATARQPAAAAWYLVDGEALDARVRERTVREMVDVAAELGGTVLPARDLPFPAPSGVEVGVRVRPGITHTIGGIRIDARARVLDAEARPIDGLFAAGADAGGIAGGGYASGLAAALVFGRIAAETALG